MSVQKIIFFLNYYFIASKAFFVTILEKKNLTLTTDKSVIFHVI